MRALFFGCLLIGFLGVGDARCGTVSGVVLREPAKSRAPLAVNRYREHQGRHREVHRDEPDVPQGACVCNPGDFAVVHLTGENLPEARMPLAPPSMAQKERAFVPAVVAVPVGGTVEFPNLDPFFHSVFSYSKVRKFDLGRYPRGESDTVRFDEPGIVPIFCEIHYSMRAYVHVLDSPFFAVSDEHRAFEIPDVAPGEYVLHVWQESLPEIVRPIVVEGESLHLEIR